MKTDITQQTQNELRYILNEYVVSDIIKEIQDLSQKISESDSKLDSKAEKNDLRAIRADITKIKESIDSMTDPDNDQIGFAQLTQCNEEILKKLKRIEKAITGLSSNTKGTENNKTNPIVPAADDNISTEIKPYDPDIPSVHDRRYKTLLGVSLSFGIINLLGVAAAIIIHFAA